MGLFDFFSDKMFEFRMEQERMQKRDTPFSIRCADAIAEAKNDMSQYYYVQQSKPLDTISSLFNVNLKAIFSAIYQGKSVLIKLDKDISDLDMEIQKNIKNRLEPIGHKHAAVEFDTDLAESFDVEQWHNLSNSEKNKREANGWVTSLGFYLINFLYNKEICDNVLNTYNPFHYPYDKGAMAQQIYSYPGFDHDFICAYKTGYTDYAAQALSPYIVYPEVVFDMGGGSNTLLLQHYVDNWVGGTGDTSDPNYILIEIPKFFASKRPLTKQEWRQIYAIRRNKYGERIVLEGWNAEYEDSDNPADYRWHDSNPPIFLHPLSLEEIKFLKETDNLYIDTKKNIDLYEYQYKRNHNIKDRLNPEGCYDRPVVLFFNNYDDVISYMNGSICGEDTDRTYSIYVFPETRTVHDNKLDLNPLLVSNNEITIDDLFDTEDLCWRKAPKKKEDIDIMLKIKDFINVIDGEVNLTVSPNSHLDDRFYNMFTSNDSHCFTNPGWKPYEISIPDSISFRDKLIKIPKKILKN